MELSKLRGIGPARLEQLKKAGIETIYDLLMVLPAGYHDTTVITPIQDLIPGEFCCVKGRLKAAPKTAHFRGITRVTASLKDVTGSIPLIWFNQPWVANQLNENDVIMLSGIPERDKQGRLRLNSPKRELEQKIYPVYKLTAGIPAAAFSKWMEQALTMLDACCPESLPYDIRMRYGLCERNFSLRQIHCPESMDALHIAQRIAHRSLYNKLCKR